MLPNPFPSTFLISPDTNEHPLHFFSFPYLLQGNDPSATAALTELDDDLGDDVRDIVDTAVFERGRAFDSAFIVKCLMGGINRRIDRRGV